jgi:pyruvate dehydrogenase E1 component alpha subunit
VDGNDPDAIYARGAEYYAYIKGGNGPCLMECVTQKWTDSVSNVRQDPKVVEEMKKPDNDCIGRFEAKLREEGVLNDEILRLMLERAQKKLREAIDFAIASPVPDPLDGIGEVFSRPV